MRKDQDRIIILRSNHYELTVTNILAQFKHFACIHSFHLPRRLCSKAIIQVTKLRGQSSVVAWDHRAGGGRREI